MTYICFICGYNQLKREPKNDYICPCCGTHFGLDDYMLSPEQLRNQWLMRGGNWFSRRTPKPNGWNVLAQLSGIGYHPSFEELAAIDSNNMRTVIVTLQGPKEICNTYDVRGQSSLVSNYIVNIGGQSFPRSMDDLTVSTTSVIASATVLRLVGAY